MDASLLKKAFMGGYNKKNVHNLLEDIAEKHAKEMASLGEEKGKLMDEVALLKAKVEELTSHLGCAEKEKDYVASAIVSAEKEAAKILAEATLKADELIATTHQALADEKAATIDLRLSVMQAMQLYKDKLDGIIDRTIKEE